MIHYHGQNRAKKRFLTYTGLSIIRQSVSIRTYAFVAGIHVLTCVTYTTDIWRLGALIDICNAIQITPNCFKQFSDIAPVKCIEVSEKCTHQRTFFRRFAVSDQVDRYSDNFQSNFDTLLRIDHSPSRIRRCLVIRMII